MDGNSPSHPVRRMRSMSTVAYPVGRSRFLAPFALALLPGFAVADERLLDFTRAVVVTAPAPTPREQLAVRMLVEEVEKRTGVRWDVHATRPADATPFIV